MKYKNNPLNIRATKSKWLGLVGQKNGFCEFSSISFGVRAGLYLLLKTYRKRGWLTLEQIINHWAPVSDGNDPENYLRFIEKRTYVRREQIYFNLPYIQKYDVLKAMCVMETGYYLPYNEFILAKNML